MRATLELECLRALWSAGAGASVQQVREGIPRELAYTTVMTVLNRMAAKGLVRRVRQGRGYAYTAALELETARQQAVERLLSTWFENDRRALAAYLGSASAAAVGTRARARRAAAGAPLRSD